MNSGIWKNDPIGRAYAMIFKSRSGLFTYTGQLGPERATRARWHTVDSMGRQSS